MPLFLLRITEPKRVGQRKARRHTALVEATRAEDVVGLFKASGSVYETPDATYDVDPSPWPSPVFMWRTFEAV